MLETFFVVMAQHDKCFVGSVLQGSCSLDWIGIRQLCVLRENSLNLPHICGASGQLQSCQTSARWDHCHASPMILGNCARKLTRHRPPKTHISHFWHHFNFACFGAVGCRVLWQTSVFFAAVLIKLSKRRIHLPVVRMAYSSVLKKASGVLQATSPLTTTNLLVLAA